MTPILKTTSIVLLLIATVNARKPFGHDWGFVTVRPGARMFWWLYTTTANVTNYIERPLLVWIQGGPGATSSGFGNFVEIGPLTTDLKPRNSTWVNDLNVLFVDNPVGSGFSTVDDNDDLPKTSQQAAEDLLVLLQEFYKKLPEWQKTPLYVFGEAYSGKTAAHVALLLDKVIKDGKLNVSLKAIGLGDSFISPLDITLNYAPYLLGFGAVDFNGYKKILDKAKLAETAINDGNFVEAAHRWEDVRDTIKSSSNNISFLNILTRILENDQTIDYFDPRNPLNKKITYLMNNAIKPALKLNVTFQISKAPYNALYGDLMRSATHSIEKILNTTDIKVAVYNGGLDLMINTLGTIKWMRKLKFCDADKWKDAPRTPITIDGYVEGAIKQVDQLAMYWVLRAGHIVPIDNPQAMRFILANITDNFKGYM